MTSNQTPVDRAHRLAVVARRPWVRRTALALVALVVLFGLFGYFVAPGIVKSQAEKAVSAALHRKFMIERVDIRPYSLAVSIHGIRLFESDGQAVFASLQDLQVRISAASLIYLAPIVKEVHLVGPSVHLARTGPNRYSTDDIVAALASGRPQRAEAPSGAKAGPRFSVYNIQIENGRFEFDDQPKRAHHTVADLQVGIPFVSSLPSQEEVFVQPLLSAVVDGAPLSVKGRARPFAPTRDAVVDLDLERVDLTRYLEYLPFEPRFKMPSGQLDVHLQASFQQPADRPPAVLLTGKLRMSALQLNTSSGDPILKLPEFVVELGKADLLGGRIDVTRVALSGLDLNVTKSARGELNLMQLAPASAPDGATAGKPGQDEPQRLVADSSAVAPSGAKPGPAPMQVSIGLIALQDAAIHVSDRDPARPLEASVEQLDLQIGDTSLDLQHKRLAVARVESVSARFGLQHGRTEGASPPPADVQPASSATAPAAHAVTGGPASTPPQPWTASVGRIAIGNWGARIESRGLPHPAVTAITGISLNAQNLSSVEGAAPGTIEVKANVNRGGFLRVAGALGVAPIHADLTLDLKSVDLLALQPYFTEKVNVLITRAELGCRGRFLLDPGADGSFKGGFRGDVSLGNLQTIDKVNADDFLTWKSLSFTGVDARLAPVSVQIDRIALADFFARIIIDPTGRINLQDIVRQHPQERRSVTAQGRAPTPVAAPAEAQPVAAPSEAPPAGSKPVTPIKVREVALQSGRVDFTDHFIKPNYSASLVDLAGTVTGLSSEADSAAVVDVHGEVNNAPLSIAGSINPIKGDLFMDLKAGVHGMELAPLSPYSGKYVGYGIEQGKLSFDVAYRLENRKLTASNRLVLDQLTFGDKIDSPTATTLPVRLAVSLLKDRNGVIDLDLPIGGSLDDPQFSIGGVIVKVLVNLVTKAVTAPFALLGSLFGGGADLSYIEYAPGSTALTSESESRLKGLAKALSERPGLKLDIAARVDPASDRAGLQRESLDRRVRAIKVKDLVAKGVAVSASEVSITPEEYPALLARVYAAQQAAAQPRGAPAQPPPPAEMEKALLASTQVGDDELIALGNQRSESVKKWLQATGQVPEQRLFLLATKLQTGAGAGEAATSAPGKVRRVEFSLK